MNGEERSVPQREGTPIEIVAPVAPVGQEFDYWVGDVPAGRESENPLPIIVASDVNLMPMYRIVNNGSSDTHGPCGSGAGLGMIMAFIGWIGLRFVGSRRW